MVEALCEWCSDVVSDSSQPNTDYVSSFETRQLCLTLVSGNNFPRPMTIYLKNVPLKEQKRFRVNSRLQQSITKLVYDNDAKGQIIANIKLLNDQHYAPAPH